MSETTNPNPAPEAPTVPASVPPSDPTPAAPEKTLLDRMRETHSSARPAGEIDPCPDCPKMGGFAIEDAKA